ncbi:MAG: hypothetical protein ACR2H6_03260 [Pyrinomonadaceae bacterium]
MSLSSKWPIINRKRSAPEEALPVRQT